MEWKDKQGPRHYLDASQRVRRFPLRESQRADRAEADSRKNEIMAMFDVLTGLPNRRQANLLMDNMISHMSHYDDLGKGVLVMMLDINLFKSINDTLGHQRGDVVLQEVAEAIRGAVRDSDVAARYGGEEFLLVVDGISIEDARKRFGYMSHEDDGRVVLPEAGEYLSEVNSNLSQVLPGIVPGLQGPTGQLAGGYGFMTAREYLDENHSPMSAREKLLFIAGKEMYSTKKRMKGEKD